MKIGDLVRQIRGPSGGIGVVVEPPEETASCGATMTGILWPNGDGGVCYHSTVWLEIVYEDR